MRKLVLLVCMGMSCLFFASFSHAGMIPGWQSPSGQFGFTPISNEISIFKNYDDSGENRGTTVQFVIINSFRFFTDFNFEFTADYNFDMAPGLQNDHYVELSLVKPVTRFVSLNYQRVITTFEPESVNQFGIRFVF